MSDTTDTPPGAGSLTDPPRPLRHLAQGAAMGAADVIPGVSGGTMALILGIYPRLIASISALAGAATALARSDTGMSRERWRQVEWQLVLPLGIGVLLALVAGSAVLPGLLERYPVQTSAVFFGLIVGSLEVPWRAAGSHGRRYGIAAVFALVAVVLVGLPETVIDSPPLWRVFVSAMVAICAMILPGVSGAFLLLVLGIYEATLDAVHARDLAYIGTFVAGAVVGLGAFSRVLRWLLATRLRVTMAALVGLMAGSLRRLWPWGGSEGRLDAPTDGAEALLALFLAGAGFVLVRAMVAVGRRGHLGDTAR